MGIKKYCNCCDKTTNVRLDDLVEYGWSAFQIPSGNGKVFCFCPDHQKEMIEQMEVGLIEQKNKKTKRGGFEK